MATKKQKTKIKKNIFLLIMFLILVFLVKVSYNAASAYISVSDVAAAQKQKEKKLEDRKIYLEKRKEDLSTLYGKERELVDKFGVKKPGEKVFIIIPEEDEEEDIR